MSSSDSFTNLETKNLRFVLWNRFLWIYSYVLWMKITTFNFVCSVKIFVQPSDEQNNSHVWYSHQKVISNQSHTVIRLSSDNQMIVIISHHINQFLSSHNFLIVFSVNRHCQTESHQSSQVHQKSSHS